MTTDENDETDNNGGNRESHPSDANPDENDNNSRDHDHHGGPIDLSIINDILHEHVVAPIQHAIHHIEHNILNQNNHHHNGDESQSPSSPTTTATTAEEETEGEAETSTRIDDGITSRGLSISTSSIPSSLNLTGTNRIWILLLIALLCIVLKMTGYLTFDVRSTMNPTTNTTTNQWSLLNRVSSSPPEMDQEGALIVEPSKTPSGRQKSNKRNNKNDKKKKEKRKNSNNKEKNKNDNKKKTKNNKDKNRTGGQQQRRNPLQFWKRKQQKQKEEPLSYKPNDIVERLISSMKRDINNDTIVEQLIENITCATTAVANFSTTGINSIISYNRPKFDIYASANGEEIVNRVEGAMKQQQQQQKRVRGGHLSLWRSPRHHHNDEGRKSGLFFKLQESFDRISKNIEQTSVDFVY